jgi:hypothetical protein
MDGPQPSWMRARRADRPLRCSKRVLEAALAVGASYRLRVFAAFGPVCPTWPAPRVLAPGASSSVSSVSGVANAIAAGAAVTWLAGGGPSACFSGSVSWASLALASGCPLSSFPSERRPPPGPRACFPSRGSRWRRPDRTPPGRAVSASRPLLLPSSAARRGGCCSENSAYVWEEFRRERRRRAYSVGWGEGVPRAQEDAAPPVTRRSLSTVLTRTATYRWSCAATCAATARLASADRTGTSSTAREASARSSILARLTIRRVPWQPREQITQRGRLLHDGAPHARHGAPAWSTCTSVKRFQHVALVHLQKLTATVLQPGRYAPVRNGHQIPSDTPKTP